LLASFVLCEILVSAMANAYRLSAYLAITRGIGILLGEFSPTITQYGAALIVDQSTSRTGATLAFFWTALDIPYAI
jgi:hypothetical protein